VTCETGRLPVLALSGPSEDEVTASSRGQPRPSTAEHQIEIWCSQPHSLLCSVNDAVNVLPCSTWSYLYGGPSLTCAAFP
jgi:hypothetical protein